MSKIIFDDCEIDSHGEVPDMMQILGIQKEKIVELNKRIADLELRLSRYTKAGEDLKIALNVLCNEGAPF